MSTPWPSRATRLGHMDVLFEEGIASDTDIPNEFNRGIDQGAPAGARPNHNQIVQIKTREEVMGERAHVGSAAWTDAPSHLAAFAAGAGDDRGGVYGERSYAHAERSGFHTGRPNAAKVVE